MTASDAVSLLLEKFPMMLQLVESPDDLLIAAPFHAYESFASEIERKLHDKAFLDSAASFINELAESGDPLLENVVTVSVLERLASDPSIAAEIKRYIGTRARDWMKRIERELFGRAE